MALPSTSGRHNIADTCQMYCDDRNNRTRRALTRRLARRPRLAFLAPVAIVLALVGFAPAGGAAGATPVSPSQADDAALIAARAEAQRSEQRLIEATAARDAAQAELNRLNARSAELVSDLADARSELRDRAIRAFVSQPADGSLLALLSDDDMFEASARSHLTARSAQSSGEEVERFNSLKADVDPVLVGLAVDLQQREQDVVDANNAVLAARANEAEAERQQSLREERERQERARRDAAAVAAAAARSSTTSTTAPSVAEMAFTSDPPPVAVGPPTGLPIPPSVPTPVALPPAALPNVPAGGPSEAQWAALRSCEAGGNYRAVSRSGKYRGAYQFDHRTWESLGGTGDPAAASPAEQDARAKLLYSQRGWRPWPNCGRFLR